MSSTFTGIDEGAVHLSNPSIESRSSVFASRPIQKARIRAKPTKRTSYPKRTPTVTVAEETVYTPDPPLKNPLRLLIRIADENWNRRELCWQLFWRNIRAQYRQTFLGLFWIFLPAIISSLVWFFLQAFRVIQFDTDVASNFYLVYVLTGVVLWQTFVEAFTKPLIAFQQNRNMLSKINFPREVVIFVSLAEVLFNAMIRSTVLIPFLVYFHQAIHWTPWIAAYPIALFGLTLIGTTIGLFLVPLGALYLDVGRVMTMIAPIWMVMTPVIYPVPEAWPANLLVYANVASPLLITGRDMILGTDLNHLWLGTLSFILVWPTFLIGLLFYRVAIPILLERGGNA